MTTPLERIRAELGAATPGPWEMEVSDGYITGHVRSPHHTYSGSTSITAWNSMTNSDAALISHIPTYLPPLLEIAEAAQGIRDWFRDNGPLLVPVSLADRIRAVAPGLDALDALFPESQQSDGSTDGDI